MVNAATVFCVEDDENIRNLVAYSLESAGFTVKGFDSAPPFFKELNSCIPGLILLDIMMPGEDGLAVLHKLRQNDTLCSIPVIMLTAKANEYDKVVGLDSGADDYITKPFSIIELIARVKAVLRRNPVENENSGEFCVGPVVLNIKHHTVLVYGAEIELTIKEFETLLFLMKNKGIVISRDTLLQNVWGYDYLGETRTVDVHIRTLRQKLGEGGYIIETVRGVGYKIGGRHD